MWSTLRRLWHYFLLGFIATFVIYVFIRLDKDKILLGLLLGVVVGLVVSIGIFLLERRFPEHNVP